MCGLPAALSVTLQDAVRNPRISGAKVTTIVQEFPGVTVAPAMQVLDPTVIKKSPGLAPTNVGVVRIDRFEVPMFCISTVMGDETPPRIWPPNPRLVGEKETIGNPVPVPDSGPVCGLPAALSVMLQLAERSPEAVGLNATLNAQVPAGMITAPVQVLPETENSEALAPVVVTLPVITRFPTPVFVTVTLCVALVVPTFWLAKMRLVGEKEIAGLGGPEVEVKAPGSQAALDGLANPVRVAPRVVSLANVAKFPVAVPLRFISCPIAGDPDCKDPFEFSNMAASLAVVKEWASQEQAVFHAANDPRNVTPEGFTQQLLVPLHGFP